jgi:hypothetical protein
MVKNKFNERTDVFSFGVMMSEVLFEEFPVNFDYNEPLGLKGSYSNNLYKLRMNLRRNS